MSDPGGGIMRTRCYPSDPTEAEWALAARHTRQRSPVVAHVSSAISVAGVWVLPHRALYPRRNWQPVGGQPPHLSSRTGIGEEYRTSRRSRMRDGHERVKGRKRPIWVDIYPPVGARRLRAETGLPLRHAGATQALPNVLVAAQIGWAYQSHCHAAIADCDDACRAAGRRSVSYRTARAPPDNVSLANN